MKTKWIVLLVVSLTLVFSASLLHGDSADDFKVIKNGVKGKKGKVEFLKVSVYNKKSKKTTVSVKVPLALIDLIAECTEENINIKGKCDIDLKKIMKVLKKHGPMTLVEVDEEDELIKVWFE